MHSLPDDDDEDEEYADYDEAVLKLMRMTAMRRMATIRSKREVNRCIFSHSWRRFWIKKDLLANQVNWKAKVVLSCSWENIINSSIFRYITWPGQALGYKVVPMFLVFCEWVSISAGKCIIDMKYIILSHLSIGGAAEDL